ncbi:hypothetical protein BBP00_00001479 [Phytophthora kernoviae]|uniref:Uncharacterized protein n=1 Tax=Phytophthora kernoviae TaxID=325452 RepID=A0A3F2S071_9STRA|nr:hypothetical protein BBP00_00001479 [Phytophthora kernoviae]
MSSYALGVYVPTLISLSGFNISIHAGEAWPEGIAGMFRYNAGSWSCVLANTPETYTTGIRARGVAYAFGFSRLGASGGALLCPRMFDKWLLSVQVITWVFAGLLTISVFGIIVPYGSDPVIRGYEFGASSVRDSDTDLESSVEGKEGHLLVNNLGEHKTIPLHYKVEEDMEFLQVEREPEPQSVKDLHEQ